jgi:hypothetical protein
MKKFVIIVSMSALLPQTHAIRGARVTLAGDSWTDSTVLGDIAKLVGFCLLVLPIGVWLIRRGQEKIRQKGYAPQTTVMFFGWLLFPFQRQPITYFQAVRRQRARLLVCSQ